MTLPQSTKTIHLFSAHSKNSKHTDTAILCALAAIAFVAACVIHECVGHGIACLAIGGKIKLLSSSFFHCSPSPVLVDAAGPSASLLFAAIAAGFLIRHQSGPITRTFLALLMVFSGCWGSGQLIDSAITNTGDMAFVLSGLELQPRWLWRTGMGIFGLCLYVPIIRQARNFLAPGRHLIQAYLVVLGVAGISALFYPGDTFSAMRECLLEVFASCGIVSLAVRRPSPHANFPVQMNEKHTIFAVLAGALVVALFWSVLGRGIRVT